MQGLIGCHANFCGKVRELALREFWRAITTLGRTTSGKELGDRIDNASNDISLATDPTFASDVFLVDDREQLKSDFAERRSKWTLISKGMKAFASDDIGPRSLLDCFATIREIKTAAQRVTPVTPAIVTNRSTDTQCSQDTLGMLALVPNDTAPSAEVASDDALTRLWFENRAPLPDVSTWLSAFSEKFQTLGHDWLKKKLVPLEPMMSLDLEQVADIGTGLLAAVPELSVISEDTVNDLKCAMQFTAEAPYTFACGSKTLSVHTACLSVFVAVLAGIGKKSVDDTVDTLEAVNDLVVYCQVLKQMGKFAAFNGEPTVEQQAFVDKFTKYLVEVCKNIDGRSAGMVSPLLEEMETKMGLDQLNLKQRLTPPMDEKALASLHKSTHAKAFGRARTSAVAALDLHQKVVENLAQNALLKETLGEDSFKSLIVGQAPGFADRLQAGNKVAAELAIVQAAFAPVPKAYSSRASLWPLCESKMAELNVQEGDMLKEVLEIKTKLV